ncbi:Mobile element protein [Pseudonocardia sp. Ae717_Ps2]|nr:Mobile element protein [Pseudonocardia sp. Ae717_Ps2]
MLAILWNLCRRRHKFHKICNSFRYASRKYWDQIAKDLRPFYTAATEAAAKARIAEFTERWGGQYPAIIALWQNAWSEFVPFLDYVRRGDPQGHLLDERDLGRSTPATGGRSGPAFTSRPSRRR